MEDQTPIHEMNKTTRAAILAVMIVLIAAVLIFKYTSPELFGSGSTSPQEAIDQSIAAGKPVMVFFYSNDCRSCQEMEKIIEGVYPEFKESVTLVKLNVYDERSRKLVERTNVHTTPAELFIDTRGEEILVLDVMEAEALRSQLETLSGGKP